MAWIELHQGLREHRKAYACAELLGISRVTMLGTLASLWLWALDNAQDGSLSGVSVKTLARVCDWPEKKAQKLVDALIETGWLDKHQGELHIHDWLDYAGRLVERREKEAKRKQEARSQRRSGAGHPGDVRSLSAGRPQDIRRTSAECPALPPPLPYHNHNQYISGDGGEYRARESDDELSKIGITPGEYPWPIPEETASEIGAIAKSLISHYCGRPATPQDGSQVFSFVAVLDEENGCYTVSSNAKDLLCYAFDQSVLAGKAGNWRYITGVMNRLYTRNITTAEQAADYDEARAGGDLYG